MRRAEVVVNLAALRRNFAVAREFSPASKNVAVVKANAYGHGATKVAQALKAYADALAVAYMDEAVKLREAGTRAPILVLQGAADGDELELAREQGFWLMLHSMRQVNALLASPEPQRVKSWLKVDTGMHRLGLDADEASKALQELLVVGIRPVVCTHLACADDPENPMTGRQATALKELADRHGLEYSIANSAGIMFWPETHAHWNRPGYMLYGNRPSSLITIDPALLVPAMTVRSRVISVREVERGEGVGYGLNWISDRPSRIATIPVGYGDGYPRHASNGTTVLVRNERCPLAGRVSMDSITVDVTGLDNVRPGDEVELWGPRLPINKLASSSGTIGYEIMTGLTGRIPVRYED